MKYIIGLGNPGTLYENNRHNIGFKVIERLAEVVGGDLNWVKNGKFKAELLRTGELTLIKPQNFMNNSGQVARQVITFYQKNIDPSQIIVIHDDLDLRLGEFKLQQGKGPKAHNGLLDLNEQFGSSEYWHLRIGVDGRAEAPQKMAGADYVLANFLPEEKEILENLWPKILLALKTLIA